MTVELFWSIEFLLFILLGLFACGHCWSLTVLYRSLAMRRARLKPLSFLPLCGCVLLCLLAANTSALLMLEVLLAERAGAQPSPSFSTLAVVFMNVLVTVALLLLGVSRARLLSYRAKSKGRKSERHASRS